MVQGSDLINNEQVHIDADMVVLATAIEPDPTARSIGTMLTAIHGHQRFLHRGPSQAAAGGKPHGGHLPLRRVPRAPRTFPKPWPRPARRPAKVIGLLAKDQPGHATPAWPSPTN